MTIGFVDAKGFVEFNFGNSVTLLSPRTTGPIKTQPMEFRNVKGCALFLTDTLDAALNVTVEVCADPDDGAGWVSVGAAKNVVANPGTAVIDMDDLPKLKNDYPWVRFSIVPATVPTAGTLAGRFYREW